MIVKATTREGISGIIGTEEKLRESLSGGAGHRASDANPREAVCLFSIVNSLSLILLLHRC